MQNKKLMIISASAVALLVALKVIHHKLSSIMPGNYATMLMVVVATYGAITWSQHKTKRKKQETVNDLGNAEIGTIKDLSGLTGKDGLLISKKVQLKESVSYEHCAIIGPTGSGKSSTFFIPNLLELHPNASVIISDPKGELYEKTKSWNKSIGRQCIQFAPLEPATGVHYNPLSECKDPTEIRQLAQNLLINGANAIAQATGRNSGGGSEWINMATPLLSASLMYCRKQRDICTIHQALQLIIESNAEQLDAIFMNDDSEVRTQYLIFKQSAESEKTMSSIKTTLSTNLQLFTDRKIQLATSSTDFTAQLLRAKPIALFIKCPEHLANYVSPLMSIFYTQILNKFMDIDGIPIYALMDEFSNIGIVPGISRLAATCRSRKLSLTIGIQGIEQIYENYGKDSGDNLLNNLKTKIFYPGLAPTTTEYASKLCGYKTVATTSKNTASDGINEGYTRRAVLDADEVRRLDNNEVLIIMHNRLPVIDAQNKYYQSKKFLKRLEV